MDVSMIKYKAISLEKKEYVYGYYTCKGVGTAFERHFILTATNKGITFGYPVFFESVEVNPDTVSEFTCFQDIYGKDLYGGDIVKEWLEDNMEAEGGYWHHSAITKLKGCWVVLSLDFDYSRSTWPDDYNFLYEDAKYILVETKPIQP